MNTFFTPRFSAMKGSGVPIRRGMGPVEPTFGARPAPAKVASKAPAAAASAKPIPVNPKNGPPCPICRG